MNKLEFLTRLRNRLESGGMPADDINDALTYYDEVFLDAGFGKEEETAASMGTPEDVAVNLLRESGIHVDPSPAMPPNRNVFPQNNAQGAYQNGYAYAQPKHSNTSFSIAMLIIGILTFPVWFPILITVVAVLFSLIVTLAAVAVGLIVSAAALLFGGIFCIFEAPAIGLMLLGIGLFATGIIILICKPIFNAVIPAFGRAIKRFCNWIVGLFKKGGKSNE